MNCGVCLPTLPLARLGLRRGCVCRVLAVSGCVGVIGTVGSSTPLLPYPRPPYATALGVLQYSSLTPTYLPHYYHCPWGSGKGGLHTAIALKTTHDQTTSCLVVSLSSPRTTLRYATHVGVVSQYTSFWQLPSLSVGGLRLWSPVAARVTLRPGSSCSRAP
jgi:hypothetical protein